MKASLPADENARLAVLRRYHILDTPPEQAYDDLTLLAARLTDTPIALVNFVDATRQWFKARHGMALRETHRDISFCAHAILDTARILIVPDMTLDPRFADNPMVVGPPHARFYAGAALKTTDGHSVGTLCVLDTRPRQLAPEQIDSLQALARLVTAQMELRLLAETRVQKDALEEANRRLLALATSDGLTGLKNHRAFQETLREHFAQSKRSQIPFSLLMLDVDHFKEYNDKYGHPAGDEILKQMGALLTGTVREGDIVARPGGEEFAVILPQTDSRRALILAERLRWTIKAAIWPLRGITASFGIATYKQSMTSPDQLIAEADTAMYQSKANGRDQVTLFPIQQAQPPLE